MCISNAFAVLTEGNKCVTHWSVSELIKLGTFWCIISCIWIDFVEGIQFYQIKNERRKNELYLFGFLGLDVASPWKDCKEVVVFCFVFVFHRGVQSVLAGGYSLEHKAKEILKHKMWACLLSNTSSQSIIAPDIFLIMFDSLQSKPRGRSISTCSALQLNFTLLQLF